MKRKTKIIAPENPRLDVVTRLRSMAEFLRTRSRMTDQADEALDWEKKLRQREQEIEATPQARAA